MRVNGDIEVLRFLLLNTKKKKKAEVFDNLLFLTSPSKGGMPNRQSNRM